MADQGRGGLTPGDPLWSGGGGEPPADEPAADDPSRPHREPAPQRAEPAPPRSGPLPYAPPVDESPATSPGYGSGPVPPGAFAPPTPAAAAQGSWVLAEWWRRAAAAIIDGVIVTVVALILLIPLAIIGLSIDTDGGAVAFGAGALVSVLLIVVASFLYAPLLMARTNGQTIGKMATNIRVVRAKGQRMDFWWAFLREIVVKALLFGTLSSFTVGLASVIDYLWPLWDGENRALHDMIVDTRVIRA